MGAGVVLLGLPTALFGRLCRAIQPQDHSCAYKRMLCLTRFVETRLMVPINLVQSPPGTALSRNPYILSFYYSAALGMQTAQASLQSNCRNWGKWLAREVRIPIKESLVSCCLEQLSHGLNLALFSSTQWIWTISDTERVGAFEQGR